MYNFEKFYRTVETCPIMNLSKIYNKQCASPHVEFCRVRRFDMNKRTTIAKHNFKNLVQNYFLERSVSSFFEYALYCKTFHILLL